MEKAELKGMFASGKIPAGAQYKEALGSVLQTFPYFQLAQVLFAKQMYDTHEPEASGRIKLASVYAPDRKAMYLLFKSSNLTVNKTIDTIKTHERSDVKYNFVYSSTASENAEVAHVLPKNEATRTETFIRKELETKPSTHVLKTEAKQMESKRPLLPPVVEKSLPLEENEPELPKIVAKEKEAEPPLKSVVLLVENQKPETIDLVSNNEPIADLNLKYSFSSWLKVIPEISIEKKPEIKYASPKQTFDIIDDFLKKDPSVSRPKAEFFSPVKAAKMSIAEDDAIVSETLAKIYVAQGNLPKALKAYQTLLLQFPEKKNIFAPRIEEIKVLMRENKKPGTK